MESAASISHYPGGHAEGFPDTFKQLFLDVYGWIVAGKEAGRPKAFPTFVDGHHEVCLCEAIARSAHSQPDLFAGARQIVVVNTQVAIANP